MGYLIDTSIFIAWEREDLDANTVLQRAADAPVALSAITASELLHGVHRADSAARRGRREKFVEQILANMQVFAVDLEVSRTHARIWADLQQRGAPIGAHDLLIAATAIRHDLTIATRNLREFARVESLRIEQW